MVLGGELPEQALSVLSLGDVLQHRHLHLARKGLIQRAPRLGLEVFPAGVGDRALVDDADLEDFVGAKRNAQPGLIDQSMIDSGNKEIAP